VKVFLFQDASLWFIPYLLFFGSLPAWFILHRFVPRSQVHPKTALIILIVCFLACQSFRKIIWSGGFREKKLAPVLSLFLQEFKNRKPLLLSPLEKSSLAKNWQEHWQRGEGNSSWVFPDSALPYYRLPLWQACAQNTWPDSALCNSDADGDGFILKEDCNDQNAQIHPLATDLPSNGIDEDCSGIDTQPWNFILIILESHRALNAGFLKEFGATHDATPFLNQLAGDSKVWSHFHVSGIPTISALMGTHLSLWHHPTRYIATSYTWLAHQSFSELLGKKGYTTHFFSSADPSWDNQTPWLSQWYQNYTYSRNREQDGQMFRHMGQWMKENLNSNKPFLVTAMTKTNHFPFNRVSEMPPYPPGIGLEDKMLRTMVYTEQSLKNLIDSIKTEPWFKKTVLVIMADHGFSTGSHGSTDMGNGLYTEHTWIPLLMKGSHPKLMNLPPINRAPSSQIDLGPTLLDLAGIAQASHAQGHSLLRPQAEELNSALVLKGNEALWSSGSWRWHGAYDPLLQRQNGIELFDSDKDRLELHNRASEHPELVKSFQQSLYPLIKLHLSLIETNSLWPEP